MQFSSQKVRQETVNLLLVSKFQFVSGMAPTPIVQKPVPVTPEAKPPIHHPTSSSSGTSSSPGVAVPEKKGYG